MLKKPQRKLCLAIGLLFFCGFLSACTSPSTPTQAVERNTQHPLPENPPDRINATSTVTPAKTCTPEKPMVFLAEPLPDGIISRDGLPEHNIGSDSQAAFWFGSIDAAPPGEVLLSSTWIYALAAPFPTLRDNIDQEELNAYWKGDRGKQLREIPQIYVPESLVPLLEARWGPHSSTTISIYTTSLDPDSLWEDNTWAILPFDALSPHLKVIQIDGVSPLLKDYEPENDPLTARYQLVRNGYAEIYLEPALFQSMKNAIQLTNRNTNKLTTLVMTGVTALVRATAYKMEINGVLYPGEEIVHWLSEADLTHISNEVSFYQDCPYPDPNSKMLLFCSDPRYIELLEYVGADIIELTGNHNMDVQYVYGIDAIPYTLELYQQKGMQYYGGGLNLAAATSPLQITHNGNQLAFLGCNAPGPDFAWATDDQSGAAPCADFKWMIDEIHQLVASDYLPITTMQYYEDYYNYAEVHHKRDFGLLAEAGAVIVNGSQAHRPKGMAYVSDAFVHYGLGNLFFDQMGYTINGENITQTRWEIIQRHTFYNNSHLSTELLTAMLEDYAQPRPMTAAERMRFLDELFSASGWISR